MREHRSRRSHAARFATPLWFLAACSTGCAYGTSDHERTSDGAEIELGGYVARHDHPVLLGRPLVPAPSGDVREAKQHAGRTYLLHVGGLCSTSFTAGKGPGELGSFDGDIGVDVAVDQRNSMAVAVPQMRGAFDAYCRGDDWCHVYTYSNGGAVVSKTLSIYDSAQWNLLWVLSAASNEGGSELSGSFAASLGDALGLKCNLSNDISPSDHRPHWNHNDTGGHTIYLVAGHDEWWYTGGFPDFFSGMANDGAVPYHSSAGLNDTYFVSDDDPWACYESEYHWANHEVAYSCRGFDVDHGGMKQKGLVELGG